MPLNGPGHGLIFNDMEKIGNFFFRVPKELRVEVVQKKLKVDFLDLFFY